MPTFKTKDQIIYIPRHAKGDVGHKDCEKGFITKYGKNDSFCRYWRKESPGILRTTSCSELTPNSCLMKYESCTQGDVERAYKSFYGRG